MQWSDDGWTIGTVAFVFGSLLCVSAGAHAVRRRPLSDRGQAIVDEIIVRTNAWWVMAGLFFAALFAGFVSTTSGGNLRLGILSLLAVAPVSLILLTLAWRTVPAAEATVVARARDAGEPV